MCIIFDIEDIKYSMTEISLSESDINNVCDSYSSLSN